MLGGKTMNKIYFCFLLSVLECLHNYATVMIVFLCFNSCLCQAMPLGRLGWKFIWSCWKTETFAPTRFVVIFYRGVILSWLFLRKINIHISQAILIFQSFWSYIRIRNTQIATDCSIFDRFCFLCVVCLFWWFYGFLWWVFAIEKLEYSRCNARTK